MDKKRSIISQKTNRNLRDNSACKPSKKNFKLGKDRGNFLLSKSRGKPRQAAANQKTLSASESQNQANVNKTASPSAKKRLNNSNKRSSRFAPQTGSFSQILALVVRVAVIAIGLSTLLGTVIAVANAIHTPLTKENNPDPQKLQAATVQSQEQLAKLFPNVNLGKENTSLKSKLQTLASQYPKLQPGIFILDLDDSSYINLQGASVFASASTIKLPVLVALFQDIDRGKIHLDEKLTMNKNDIGSGSGSMQYEKPGTQFTVLEIATKMITISDNTATNMLIAKMGGAEKLNQRFLEWGLNETVIRNPLPDLEGTNTTSPEDLGDLLVNLERGKLVSLKSRDRMLSIMRNLVRNTLLPEGLEEGAIIAHKTGDIRSVLGDVGIIDMPSGKRYIASVLVKRPDNDPQAKEFIQKMSQVVYQHLKWQNSNSNVFTQDEFTQ